MSCLRRRVELSYRQYNERIKDDVEESYKEAESIVGRNADRDESSERAVFGNNDSNGYRGEIDVVPGQTLGEKLRSDTGRSVSTVDRGGAGSQVRLNDENDVRYQSRKYLEDDYSTDGVHLGIEEGIITKSDARVVWQEIADIQKRGYNSYPKTVYGDYFVESGNKLMVVNADYRRPTVKTIFVFNDTSETNMSEAKELLIDAQGIYERLQNAWDIIRDVQGEEYISRYDCEDSPSYERKNPGRERSNSGEDIDGEIQYQQRTDTLTDRRVLELAAEDVRIDDLTQGEVSALDVFKKRLETIRDLQAQRKEQGGGYRGRKDCLTGEAEILNLCLF